MVGLKMSRKGSRNRDFIGAGATSLEKGDKEDLPKDQVEGELPNNENVADQNNQ